MFLRLYLRPSDCHTDAFRCWEYTNVRQYLNVARSKGNHTQKPSQTDHVPAFVQSLIPFSMPYMQETHCPTSINQQQNTSWKGVPFVICGCGMLGGKEPNRLLRMQAALVRLPFTSRCRRRQEFEFESIWSPPRPRPSWRSASPPVSPTCAPGRPWSWRAWHPSPP